MALLHQPLGEVMDMELQPAGPGRVGVGDDGELHLVILLPCPVVREPTRAATMLAEEPDDAAQAPPGR
ncbi:hypothetical protein MANAM107_05140 [Actinomyces capricornis]|uniref:Uncharacterized protein n=1 Tax=Actinomyces capricornis TaxID=2755559 RepID=A0ABN6K295_9ACTO|nr:hypothetical protein MANAM107_05140 [Actinomyces capricornis]